MQQETRACQNCKNQFTIEPEDFNFYEKIKVPPPTWCPECRLQRRFAYRNERTLYKRKCGLCGKDMVSIFSLDKPFTVYCGDCWWSDKWDPMEHGREYDFSRPFFEQYRELLEDVPQLNLWGFNNVNSDFSNYVGESKNVYLSYSVTYCEDIFYSSHIDKSRNCFDCYQVKNTERCYENVNAEKCYESHFLLNSRECVNSAFLFDCVNCQDCFMSSNLRNKQFYVRNKAYSHDDYMREMEKIWLSSYGSLESLKEEFRSLREASLHKFANAIKVLNTTGDDIVGVKNGTNVFFVQNSENVKNCWRVYDFKDSYDVTGAIESELLYEVSVGAYHNYSSRFYSHGKTTRFITYCYFCSDVANLFGCSGLKSKQYCIFNKQYSEKDYKALVERITKQMDDVPYVSQIAKSKERIVYKFGEFFPTALSPFAYNESVVQEYFPLTKEEVLAKRYSWRDPDPYPHKPTVMPENLPDDIKDVPDSIINEVIGCPDCGRAYRIIKPELEFLRHEKIALPRKCPDCRYKDRFALRNPLKLWARRCGCHGKASALGIYRNTTLHFHGEKACPNEFETSYSPERKEAVYCEACYQSEIF